MMPFSFTALLAVAPFAAVTLGLAATLALFLSLKSELHRNSRSQRKRIDELLARLQEAQADWGSAPVFVPASPLAGTNVSRRVHAMRLLRKGADAAHVAAVLGVPRPEIELLIRVQKLVADSGERNSAAAVAAASTVE